MSSAQPTYKRVFDFSSRVLSTPSPARGDIRTRRGLAAARPRHTVGIAVIGRPPRTYGVAEVFEGVWFDTETFGYDSREDVDSGSMSAVDS